MPQKTLDEQISRAKELLSTVQHASMATVNEDGSPHNTPFFLAYSTDLKYLYWGSHPQSLHSQNVVRTGRVFVVLYEADKRGGLFMRAEHARIAEANELDDALGSYNQRRSLHGKERPTRGYYEGDNPQRLYVADAVQFWVNGSERGTNGLVIRDIRTEIPREALL